MPRPITGRGITTHVGMELADLGIARWDAQRGANAVMFGDNFSFSWGQDWQSPSIVMYDDDYQVAGIPTTGGIMSEGMRRQTIPYTHNEGGISTILPCDFIRIGRWWYVAAMVVGMGGLGNELRTVFWQSHDLVDWQKTDPYVALGHPGHPGNVMLTFDRIGDYVYIFGTGGLARDRGVWMWRNKTSEFPHGHWEPWGYDGYRWDFGVANERSPILAGRFGELCFRNVQGNCVLSFFDVDEYKQTALTVSKPTDDWSNANQLDYAWGHSTPQLYGGYITPASRLNEPAGMGFIVSQWNTRTNHPYHCVLFDNMLQAKGPLTEVPIEPEPPPLVPSEPPPVEPPPPTEESPVTTPQELYDLMLRELSASGSTEILTPDGRKLTMREAIGEIYDQTCSLHDLKNQMDPRVSVPQLDHILAARFEQLFTQAVVVAVADKFGIDVNNLYAQVKESLG